jgi:tRNA (adenine37-N6)-methyltransferase
VVWHADKLPPWNDARVMVDKPYRKAPVKLGIFATRSPFRPNSFCMNVLRFLSIDTILILCIS